MKRVRLSLFPTLIILQSHWQEMDRYNTAYSTGLPPSEASSSSSRLPLHRPTRPAARTASTSFEPLDAHARLQRMHALKQFYENSRGNRLPAKPSSRGELDVLKERHQCAPVPFVRLGYRYGYGYGYYQAS